MLTRALPKRVFPHGQRTGDPGQRLYGDQSHSGEVCNAERQIVYPFPAQNTARKNEYFPADGKPNVQEMDGDNQIGC